MLQVIRKSTSSTLIYPRPLAKFHLVPSYIWSTTRLHSKLAHFTDDSKLFIKIDLLTFLALSSHSSTTLTATRKYGALIWKCSSTRIETENANIVLSRWSTTGTSYCYHGLWYHGFQRYVVVVAYWDHRSKSQENTGFNQEDLQGHKGLNHKTSIIFSPCQT